MLFGENLIIHFSRNDWIYPRLKPGKDSLIKLQVGRPRNKSCLHYCGHPVGSMVHELVNLYGKIGLGGISVVIDKMLIK